MRSTRARSTSTHPAERIRIKRIAQTCREVLKAQTFKRDMDIVNKTTWGRSLKWYLLCRHLEPILIYSPPRSWLDSGCGKAVAIKEYKKNYPEVFCCALDMRDFQLDHLDKKIIGNVSCLPDTGMTFDLITDVYGPASYARNPLQIIDMYLRQLNLNGNLCLLSDYSRTNTESVDQIVYDRRGMVVIDDSGQLVNFPEYLQAHSSGIEVDWFRTPLDTVEELKIRKTKLNYKLPDLATIKFRPDFPPLNIMVKKEDVPAIEKILRECGEKLIDLNIAAEIFHTPTTTAMVVQNKPRIMPVNRHTLFTHRPQQAPTRQPDIWRPWHSIDRSAKRNAHEYTKLNSNAITWVKVRPADDNNLYEFEIIAGKRGCRYYSFDTISSGAEYNTKLMTALEDVGIKADSPNVITYPKNTYIDSIFCIHVTRQEMSEILPKILTAIESLEGHESRNELEMKLTSILYESTYTARLCKL